MIFTKVAKAFLSLKFISCEIIDLNIIYLILFLKLTYSNR